MIVQFQAVKIKGRAMLDGFHRVGEKTRLSLNVLLGHGDPLYFLVWSDELSNTGPYRKGVVASMLIKTTVLKLTSLI